MHIFKTEGVVKGRCLTRKKKLKKWKDTEIEGFMERKYAKEKMRSTKNCPKELRCISTNGSQKRICE